MKKTALFIALISLVTMSAVGNEKTSQLEEFAKQHDCTPLWKIYEKGETSNPWKIDLSSLSGTEGDYAFICEENSKEYVHKILLKLSSNTALWKNCPKQIYAGFSAPQPQGFEIHEKLDRYFFSRGLSEWCTKGGKCGPKEGAFNDPVIDTSNGDLGVMLYCHEREWYGYFIH